MSQPIVIAHHIMWTLYGWWLPNDPRGSTSSTIHSDPLRDLGELHTGRKAVQPSSADIRAFYHQAAERLNHALLKFDQHDLPRIAEAIGESIAHHRYTCYAAAILPDHVHLIIRKHRHTAEQMIDHLQHDSRSRLSALGLRPSDHPTWTRGGWKVFLDTPDDIRRTVGYIERNPDPYRWPRQRWSFVTAYDGWPLHPGHSPNSPYAQRLRTAGKYRPNTG